MSYSEHTLRLVARRALAVATACCAAGAIASFVANFSAGKVGMTAPLGASAVVFGVLALVLRQRRGDAGSTRKDADAEH